MTNPLAPAVVPTPEALREALRTVADPEAGVNIVDLGLVYGLQIDGDVVRVTMTMTSPACPMSEVIIDDVVATLNAKLPPAMRTEVELVWSPPWDPEMMSDKARRHFEW